MFEHQAIKETKEKFGRLSQNELIRYTYINYPYYTTKSTILSDLSGDILYTVENIIVALL